MFGHKNTYEHCDWLERSDCLQSLEGVTCIQFIRLLGKDMEIYVSFGLSIFNVRRPRILNFQGCFFFLKKKKCENRTKMGPLDLADFNPYPKKRKKFWAQNRKSWLWSSTQAPTIGTCWGMVVIGKLWGRCESAASHWGCFQPTNYLLSLLSSISLLEPLLQISSPSLDDYCLTSRLISFSSPMIVVLS